MRPAEFAWRPSHQDCEWDSLKFNTPSDADAPFPERRTGDSGKEKVSLNRAAPWRSWKRCVRCAIFYWHGWWFSQASSRK